MSFTAKDVMALRQKTGLGMLDCKKALTENGGDAAQAEQWLREKLKGKMDTRTERTTGEGRIAVAFADGCAVIVELRTETDFAAKNEKFLETTKAIAEVALAQPTGDISVNSTITALVDELRVTTQENANFARGLKMEGGTFGSYVHHDGKRGVLLQVEGDAGDDLLRGICQHIVFHDPKGIDENDVPAEVLEEVRNKAIEDAKESGKPEEIAAKMAEGRVRKYLEESTLLNQKYVLDESQRICDILPDSVTVKKFIRYTLGS